MRNRALFLDRDGTVIEDRGYMRDPADVQLLPGAAEALSAIASEGWKLIVISNQSGVGRGLILPEEMQSVQARFLEIMNASGTPITASYFCTHKPDDACECRKPAAFLLQQAARDHNIDLTASWMAGDREADIVCGKNAGCSTIWLRNETFPAAGTLATFIASDWSEIRQKLSEAHHLAYRR